MRLKSNIYKLINEKGYMKRYIAENMDVSVKQLWNWDNCVSYPTTPKLFQLAYLLGVKTDDLYEVIDDKET